MGSSSNLAAASGAFLLFVTTLTLIQLAYAQNSPQDFVNAHNSARKSVGVGPVSWDAKLEAYAKKYAHQRVADCKMVHSKGPYGENLFKGYGKPYSAAYAVKQWVAEKQYYDYSSNTCASGKVCGHYTQVVWAKSVAIGCARVTCNNGYIYIICSYNPPGNYIGQRPY
ncbi:pathogenesis-related protein PRB1-3-like [Iris pallida]|uniref:Pathogenesis-related protein PRB1-3-like n=1 Tax=Iris pallida TaxID=29817 RepID=A0AAX6I725_IRIPA|nr:pathogenesis-related protein PRB1-3-like [Iris pallida]KAJ6791410.1 pathogenesis-related protein PRB1-3-like [Iris pallida]KAJ6848811.1 pathogenesis-related protein PRB1-3-like [Iris pallida]